MKNISIGAAAAIILTACSSAGHSQGTNLSPAASDTSIPYYDRHLIDVSNLRDLYEGMMIIDTMIRADAMFDTKTKWKMTLYQMIKADSNHYQARSAYHLAYLGVPRSEILEIWSPGYIETIGDERTRAAFEFIDAISTLPASINADTHANLRMHFTDRQIAELMEMAAANASNAALDNVLPIPTDPATIEWANENLASVGWEVGPNSSSNALEQRDQLFAGETLDSARQEIISSWDRINPNAPIADFTTDWLNTVTGYGIPRATIDSDKDGVEDPFDFYPIDASRWQEPSSIGSNTPPGSAPTLEVAAYDVQYYEAPKVPKTKYPYSDRIRFDTEWTRQNAMGTSRVENYFAAGDRALDMHFMWQVFVVYQLASGCTHCQVHGTRWLYESLEDQHGVGTVPDEAMRDIYDLFDFERSDRFSDAQLAAFRFARDSGPLPAKTTAVHIEDLRRHFSNRQIQELMMIIGAGSRLSAGQQANVTVTDRTSMAWALRDLVPIGWRPGGHLGRIQ